MKSHLMVVACVALFLVPLYFIACKVYRDGIFGRIALGLIAFLAGARLVDLYHGSDIDVLWETVLMYMAFAIFLTWHLFRFHNRVIRRMMPTDQPDRRLTPQ